MELYLLAEVLSLVFGTVELSGFGAEALFLEVGQVDVFV